MLIAGAAGEASRASASPPPSAWRFCSCWYRRRARHHGRLMEAVWQPGRRSRLAGRATWSARAATRSRRSRAAGLCRTLSVTSRAAPRHFGSGLAARAAPQTHSNRSALLPTAPSARCPLTRPGTSCFRRRPWSCRSRFDPGTPSPRKSPSTQARSRSRCATSRPARVSRPTFR